MAIGTFPESWNLSIRDEIASGVKALTVNPTFISITKAIRSSVVIYLLRPLDMYLTYLHYLNVDDILTNHLSEELLQEVIKMKLLL